MCPKAASWDGLIDLKKLMRGKSKYLHILNVAPLLLRVDSVRSEKEVTGGEKKIKADLNAKQLNLQMEN